MTTSKRAVATMGVAAVFLLAACGSGGSDKNSTGGDVGEPQSGGSASAAFNLDVPTMDPAICGTTTGWMACSSVYGSLVVFNHDTQEYEPRMAESFESEDGATWTIKIRPDVKFTDGTAYDADAVIYNWDRIVDPKTLSPAMATASEMEWKKVDDLTVELTLSQPNFLFPATLESEMGMIGSPSAFESGGSEKIANEPVGAGPFTLDSWTRGTQMVLKRNADYWDDPRPYLDEFVIKTIPPDDQRYNALNSGELDVAITLVQEYADKATDGGYDNTSLPFISGTGARISHEHGDLADKDVREAVGKLFDAEAFVNAFYPGTEVPTLFSPTGGILENPEAKFPTLDVDGAQKLIDGYLARTGKDSVNLTYRTTAGVPLLNQVAELFQSQLQEVDGLKLEILSLESAQYQADTRSGNFDMYLSGINTFNPDVLYNQFHTNGPQNTGGYSNPEVDKLIEQARSTAEKDQRLQLYKDASVLIAQDNVFRPWRFSSLHLLHDGDKLQGVTAGPGIGIRSELLWRVQ